MDIKRYETDLDELIKFGGRLMYALRLFCYPSEITKQLKKQFKKKYPEESDKQIEKRVQTYLKKFPVFSDEYQNWYSESLALLKQLLPDRCEDFISQYKKPKVSRKDISCENYVIEDALHGLAITRPMLDETVVDASAAIPRLRQQIAMIESAKRRFKSSLFDIRALVAADVFDSEIDSAQALHKNKFYRAAGTVCGVIIEKHLSEVCKNHGVSIRRKHPSIADFNDALKNNGTTDTPKWRQIQFLADIRNNCSHSKSNEPTSDEVQDLINGTSKLIKTLF